MSPVSRVLTEIESKIAEVGTILSQDPQGFAEAASRKNDWTAPQVADHLCQVHLGMIRAVKSSAPMPKRTLKSRIALPMMRFVMTRGIQVPAGGAEPSAAADADLAPILETLTNLHARLVDASEKSDFDPDQFGFEHPFVGPLSKIETLEFIRDHLRYHILRAKSVLKWQNPGTQVNPEV